MNALAIELISLRQARALGTPGPLETYEGFLLAGFRVLQKSMRRDLPIAQ